MGMGTGEEHRKSTNYYHSKLFCHRGRIQNSSGGMNPSQEEKKLFHGILLSWQL